MITAKRDDDSGDDTAAPAWLDAPAGVGVASRVIDWLRQELRDSGLLLAGMAETLSAEIAALGSVEPAPPAETLVRIYEAVQAEDLLQQRLNRVSSVLEELERLLKVTGELHRLCEHEQALSMPTRDGLKVRRPVDSGDLDLF